MKEGPAATEESSGPTSDAPGPKGEGGREATTRISEESCQQKSWTEVPKYFSHAWTPGHRYCNPTWAPNAPPLNQKTSKPPVQSVGDRVVQVRIPLGQSTRKNRRPGAIEICCGHAGLTAALCDAGLDGVGVDWKRNKHKPTVPIVNADLTTEAGQKFVWELVQQEHVMYVHLARTTVRHVHSSEGETDPEVAVGTRRPQPTATPVGRAAGRPITETHDPSRLPQSPEGQ